LIRVMAAADRQCSRCSTRSMMRRRSVSSSSTIVDAMVRRRLSADRSPMSPSRRWCLKRAVSMPIKALFDQHRV
jgi:hypothetical protein